MIKLIFAFLVAAVSDIPWLKTTGWQWFYQILATIRPDDFKMMNYGFAGPTSLELPVADIHEKYSYQLYHHTIGEIDLTRRDVLEVGCGRGGGTSYIYRYLNPQKLVGVDISDKAIDLCKSRHQGERLEFVTGNAEKLPFPDQSFDAIINVESAVCYASRANFFREVSRILRPGGYFLYADIEKKESVDNVHQLLEQTRLKMVRRETINPNVIQACDLDGPRRKGLIDSLYNSSFSRIAMYNFAAVPGSYMYRQIKTGKIQYFSYILKT